MLIRGGEVWRDRRTGYGPFYGRRASGNERVKEVVMVGMWERAMARSHIPTIPPLLHRYPVADFHLQDARTNH